MCRNSIDSRKLAARITHIENIKTGSNMKKFIQDIKREWENMTAIPVMEFETANGDYLVVDISWDDNGLLFQFDEEDKPVFFDGDIDETERPYRLPFDECFTRLQHYLERISEEIQEGFLIPNDLV